MCFEQGLLVIVYLFCIVVMARCPADFGVWGSVLVCNRAVCRVFFFFFFFLLNFNVIVLKKERTGGEVCLTSGG